MNANQHPLLAQTDELQRRAKAILDKLGLFKRWSAIGEPLLVGSVRFGLLCSPNIDLEIYCDAPDIDRGFGVISDLAQVPGVNQIVYLNAMGTADQGLYWRIDYTDETGTVWDIDNWLVAHDHPDAGLADGLAKAMQERLTDETRLKILEIKKSFAGEQKPRGVDVYKAVLQGGVTNAKQFRQWIQENPPAVIEQWRP